MNRQMNNKEIYYYPKSSKRIHKAVIRYPHYQRAQRDKYRIIGRVDIYNDYGEVILTRKNLSLAEIKVIEDNIKRIGTILYTTEQV